MTVGANHITLINLLCESIQRCCHHTSDIGFLERRYAMLKVHTYRWKAPTTVSTRDIFRFSDDMSIALCGFVPIQCFGVCGCHTQLYIIVVDAIHSNIPTNGPTVTIVTHIGTWGPSRVRYQRMDSNIHAGISVWIAIFMLSGSSHSTQIITICVLCYAPIPKPKQAEQEIRNVSLTALEAL